MILDDDVNRNIRIECRSPNMSLLSRSFATNTAEVAMILRMLDKNFVGFVQLYYAAVKVEEEGEKIEGVTYGAKSEVPT